jgi:MFS family permease
MTARGDTDGLQVLPLLYAWRNVVQAVVSFPAGWLSDRVGPRRILVAGYALGAGNLAGFALLFLVGPVPLLVLFGMFTLYGCYFAVEEALESVVTAELVPDRTMRGTAYGLLGVVNGFGDLAASLLVGLLMQYTSPVLAFGAAAALMLAGVAVLAWAFARPSGGSAGSTAPGVAER